MANKLVIVESPHKAHTIQGYLGKDYKVVATMGHIRDLAVGNAKCHLGVEVKNNFNPLYEVLPGKHKVVNNLNYYNNEKYEIYLATDPDREGEAISWHIADTLGLDLNTAKRLEFHEVTYHAIKDAVDNPRSLNMDLVHSQESRRIIDRILGFKLSNLFKKKLGVQSVGRVQSVVVKLVVERQKEIDAFKSETFYKVSGKVLADGKEVEVTLVDNAKKEIHYKTEQEAIDAINYIKNNDIKVKSIDEKVNTRSSKPVYTTSTMQQEASSILKMNSKKTMSCAQELYEGVDVGNGSVGLITYMRTDSVRITPVFINKVKEYIKNEFGDNYVGTAKIFNNSKEKVQDAHEGIRPTDINITPDMLIGKTSEENYKLYKLIYNRTLASIMSDEKYNHEEIIFTSGDYNLLAIGEETIFDGFTKVDNSVVRKPLESKITNNSIISHPKLNCKEGATKGPSAYTEATLIHQMEKDGIGRPSTYATTIDTIKKHGYVEVRKNAFYPTADAYTLVDNLEKSFEEFIDIGYTANMESKLDEIAEGSETELNYLTNFYDKFKTLLEKANIEIEETVVMEIPDELKEELGLCPDCGMPLVKRNGKYGEFLACSGYPKCKYIKSLDLVGTDCPTCGVGKLIKRTGAFGQFYACSNYPACKYTKTIQFSGPKKTTFKKNYKAK